MAKDPEVPLRPTTWGDLESTGLLRRVPEGEQYAERIGTVPIDVPKVIEPASLTRPWTALVAYPYGLVRPDGGSRPAAGSRTTGPAGLPRLWSGRGWVQP